MRRVKDAADFNRGAEEPSKESLTLFETCKAETAWYTAGIRQFCIFECYIKKAGHYNGIRFPDAAKPNAPRTLNLFSNPLQIIVGELYTTFLQIVMMIRLA